MSGSGPAGCSHNGGTAVARGWLGGGRAVSRRYHGGGRAVSRRWRDSGASRVL